MPMMTSQLKNTSFNRGHSEYLVFPHFWKEHCTANYNVPQFFKNTGEEYELVLNQATLLKENQKIMCKASLGGALINLVFWNVFLPMAGGLEQDDL